MVKLNFEGWFISPCPAIPVPVALGYFPGPFGLVFVKGGAFSKR